MPETRTGGPQDCVEELDMLTLCLIRFSSVALPPLPSGRAPTGDPGVGVGRPASGTGCNFSWGQAFSISVPPGVKFLFLAPPHDWFC